VRWSGGGGGGANDLEGGVERQARRLARLGPVRPSQATSALFIDLKKRHDSAAVYLFSILESGERALSS